MEEEEFSSDTSDDDYVPSDGHVVSEEEDSGVDETVEGEKDKKTNETVLKATGKRKRTRRKGDFDPRKRKGGIKLDDVSDEAAEDEVKQMPEGPLEQVKEEIKEKKEKKKADDLWADFMKDVGPTKPNRTLPSTGLGALSSLTKPISTAKTTTAIAAKSSQQPSSTQTADDKKPDKITITKEYDFAGEVVKITKEVDADGKEAREMLQKQNTEEGEPSASSSTPVFKKSGGGLGNVLGKIGKKEKISTLEKSKLDWNSFKKKEGIEDDLQIHNRGKDGYIERMSFLERADYRQFEIERNLRMTSSKR